MLSTGRGIKVMKDVEGTFTTHFLEGIIWIKKLNTLKVNTKKIAFTKKNTNTYV